MGVYIKDMKMPTRCIACQLNYDSCACILTGSRFYKYNTEFDPGEERLSDCPLVPVPSHGRCIDADELLEHAWRDRLDSRELIAGMINSAPTVISAEEDK